MPKFRYPDPLPSWFVNMNPKSLCSARDVAALFGFKNFGVATSEANQGLFPKADVRLGGNTPGHAKKCQWRKSTILAEIERRKKCAQQ